MQWGGLNWQDDIRLARVSVAEAGYQYVKQSALPAAPILSLQTTQAAQLLNNTFWGMNTFNTGLG